MVSGRCYHHLGLFHFAILYYKRVLTTPPASPKEVQLQIDKMNRSIARNRDKSGDVKSGQTTPSHNDNSPENDVSRENSPTNSNKKGGLVKEGINPPEGTDHPEEGGEKTLETGDHVELKDIDLTREAVFNMCQIYEACGSEHLARQLLYQYSVV